MFPTAAMASALGGCTWKLSLLPMNLGPPASLPAWQSARNTPAGMPAVPTTRRFMAGEQVRTEHETFHEPIPLERPVHSAAPLR